MTVIGLTGLGFASGVHRLIWGLFWLLTAVWWLLLAMIHKPNSEVGFLLLFGVVPPIVIGFLLKIVEGVVVALFGGFSKSDGSPIGAARPAEEKSADNSREFGKEKARRRALGYDD